MKFRPYFGGKARAHIELVLKNALMHCLDAKGICYKHETK